MINFILIPGLSKSLATFRRRQRKKFAVILLTRWYFFQVIVWIESCFQCVCPYHKCTWFFFHVWKIVKREREREEHTVLLTDLLTRQWNEIVTRTLTISHTNDRVVRIVIDVIIKEDVMRIRTIQRQPQRFSCTWDIIIVFPKLIIILNNDDFTVLATEEFRYRVVFVKYSTFLFTARTYLCSSVDWSLQSLRVCVFVLTLNDLSSLSYLPTYLCWSASEVFVMIEIDGVLEHYVQIFLKI
jgi:hypothetical protein